MVFYISVVIVLGTIFISGCGQISAEETIKSIENLKVIESSAKLEECKKAVQAVPSEQQHRLRVLHLQKHRHWVNEEEQQRIYDFVESISVNVEIDENGMVKEK